MEWLKQWQNILPGMRAVKTAIAVMLCMLIAALTHWLSPFFMALAAIITMQVSTVDSFKIGRMRILGTAVGAGIGLSLVLIKPESVLLSGLGILLIVAICTKLQWHGAVQIAAFVFMAIMLNMNGQNPFIYSGTRLLDTAVGVLIGVGVNYGIAPYNNLSKIHDLLYDVKAYLEAEIDPETGLVAIEPLRAKMLALKSEVGLYKQEARIQRKERAVFEVYERAFELYWDAFEHFKHIERVVNELNETSVEDFIAYEELQAVYRFHWKHIQKDLANIVLSPLVG